MVAVAVAKCGSFSSAAAELHLSAASVSARLAALERRLGKKLFKRGARGSSLTPAGERFVDYAERCLRILDEAVAQVGSTRSERLVVAAPASLGSLLFPLTLSVLAPYAIDVHCRVAHSDEVVRQVRDGVAHAGFVISTSPEEPMRSIRVGTSAIVAVTRPDSHLARRDRIKVVDLLTAPLIAYRWGPDADT
ncbi:LysR family transcriptional regulator, partial [Mycobacterium sp. NPDC003449]